MDHPFQFLYQNALPAYARSEGLRWWLRRWHQLKQRLSPERKRVLVYVGMHRGREFDMVFRDYEACYGFEANPELYALLVEKYKNYPHVKLFNAAATDRNGPVTLNVSNNAGAASSLGSFDADWERTMQGEVRMVQQFTVPGVNLGEFLQGLGVDFVDDYISDIQGMDLTVLKTLEPWIDAGRIGTITVETTREDKRNIYKDLPSNSESGFFALLGQRYRLVAMGFGVLQDYWFDPVDRQSWEVDCRWRLR